MAAGRSRQKAERSRRPTWEADCARREPVAFLGRDELSARCSVVSIPIPPMASTRRETPRSGNLAVRKYRLPAGVSKTSSLTMDSPAKTRETSSEIRERRRKEIAGRRPSASLAKPTPILPGPVHHQTRPSCRPRKSAGAFSRRRSRNSVFSARACSRRRRSVTSRVKARRHGWPPISIFSSDTTPWRLPGLRREVVFESVDALSFLEAGQHVPAEPAGRFRASPPCGR